MLSQLFEMGLKQRAQTAERYSSRQRSRFAGRDRSRGFGGSWSCAVCGFSVNSDGVWCMRRWRTAWTCSCGTVNKGIFLYDQRSEEAGEEDAAIAAAGCGW